MKRKYQERRINREKQWPPCHSDKLVRLELVEREKGEGYSANTQRGREDKGIKRTPLAYGDLFKVESGKRRVRKVLVEGDAGIGKTTLCIAVSEDWANGKLFQQFELILLLPLRMKAVASAGSLPELLKLLHISPRFCDSVARYLEDEEGESVLIIADGWDELGESQRQEGSFLYQLFFNTMVSVVVTSRPSASAPLRKLPDIDRFVEVRGFSKEHIVEYIQSEFTSDQGKADRLREQLEGNPLVESVCSVPLNCAIICHLWRTLEEALPTTMTELYTKVILNLVLRNIHKFDSYESVLKLPKFDSLPADLQQSWWLLCEFAFRALEKDQLVFSQEELEAFFPEGLALDKRILCFGLLQSAESVGVGISFHFLHLTFQEYLAALHLTRQPTDKQLEVFQTYNVNSLIHLHKLLSPHRFLMVWRFYFGINSSLKFNGDTISFIQQTLECVAGNLHYPNNLSLCHCAFEAHNDLINKAATQFIVTHPEFNNNIDFGFTNTALDCSAVLYVITNLQECGYNLHVTFCNASENQITELMHILASKKGKLQIYSLILSGSRLTVSSLQALESAVRGDVLAKLKYLNLEGSLTSDADTNAKWLATLSDHCPNLKNLDLSNNNLGVPGASALAKLHVSGQLILNKTNLGDRSLTILVKSLKVRILYLEDNDIHASGISCLGDAGEIFWGALHLSGNPLGIEGTIVVGRILSNSHGKPYYVNLSRCDLTTAGGGLPSTDSISCGAMGQQLCQMPRTSTIKTLDLDHNSFTGDGIHILAGLMHLCPGLKTLNTRGCGITSDDLIWLLDKLKSSSPGLCSELEDWELQDNQIDGRGVSALFHLGLADNDIHASGISCLGDAVCSGEFLMVLNSLDLSGNPLGLKGTIGIGRMLSSSHCELHRLSLSKCDLTTAGSCADLKSCEAVGRQLCQMPQTSTIHHLYLGYNSFTGDGIHILAGFMHLCPGLERLSTRDCGITSDDLIWLLGKLKSSSPDLCSELKQWYLRDNQIDGRGVSALIDHLPLLPRLWCDEFNSDIISLYNNPVTHNSEVMEKLEEELTRHRQERFEEKLARYREIEKSLEEEVHKEVS